MAKGVQKNFTLPKSLAKNWNKFQPKGSKESSANASGALFLYMLMPASVREVARSVAHESNFNSARKAFWDTLERISKDALLAKVLLDAVGSHEEASGKKMAPEPKKSLQDALQMIKEMVAIEEQQPGTIYRVLSPAEQKIVDDFIKAVGPDQQKQRKKAKKA